MSMNEQERITFLLGTVRACLDVVNENLCEIDQHLTKSEPKDLQCPVHLFVDYFGLRCDSTIKSHELLNNSHHAMFNGTSVWWRASD